MPSHYPITRNPLLGDPSDFSSRTSQSRMHQRLASPDARDNAATEAAPPQPRERPMKLSVSLPALVPNASAATLTSPAAVLTQLRSRLLSKERQQVKQMLSSLDLGGGYAERVMIVQGLRLAAFRSMSSLAFSAAEIERMLETLPDAPTAGTAISTTTSSSADAGSCPPSRASGPGATGLVPLRPLLFALERGQIPISIEQEASPASRSPPELARLPSHLSQMRINWPARKAYSGELMVRKLQEALIASGARTLDLLRSWDTDGNNSIDIEEFREAMVHYGCPADVQDINSLFARLDVDHSGTLSLLELHRMIRHGGLVKAARPLYRVGAKPITQKEITDPPAATSPTSLDRIGSPAGSIDQSIDQEANDISGILKATAGAEASRIQGAVEAYNELSGGGAAAGAYTYSKAAGSTRTYMQGGGGRGEHLDFEMGNPNRSRPTSQGTGYRPHSRPVSRSEQVDKPAELKALKKSASIVSSAEYLSDSGAMRAAGMEILSSWGTSSAAASRGLLTDVLMARATEIGGAIRSPRELHAIIHATMPKVTLSQSDAHKLFMAMDLENVHRLSRRTLYDHRALSSHADDDADDSPLTLLLLYNDHFRSMASMLSSAAADAVSIYTRWDRDKDGIIGRYDFSLALTTELGFGTLLPRQILELYNHFAPMASPFKVYRILQKGDIGEPVSKAACRPKRWDSGEASKEGSMRKRSSKAVEPIQIDSYRDQVIKDVHSKQLEQSVRAEMRVQLAAQRYVERERGGGTSSIFAEIPRQGPGPNFAIKMHQTTSMIDDAICGLLAVGTLRFLRATWLVKVFKDGRRRFERMQQLPAEAFASPEEAAATLRRSDRSVIVLSHPWRTSHEPDPEGVTLRNVITYLQRQAKRQLLVNMLVFVDYCCLPQAPRTEAQEASFSRACEEMVHLYATTSTAVVQVKDMPRSHLPSSFPPSPVSPQDPSAEEAGLPAHSFETVLEYNLLPYEARGWTSAEEAWAVLITSLVREALSEIKLTSRPEHMQVPERFREKLTDISGGHDKPRITSRSGFDLGTSGANWAATKLKTANFTVQSDYERVAAITCKFEVDVLKSLRRAFWVSEATDWKPNMKLA